MVFPHIGFSSPWLNCRLNANGGQSWFLLSGLQASRPVRGQLWSFLRSVENRQVEWYPLKHATTPVFPGAQGRQMPHRRRPLHTSAARYCQRVAGFHEVEGTASLELSEQAAAISRVARLLNSPYAELLRRGDGLHRARTKGWWSERTCRQPRFSQNDWPEFCCLVKH